MSKKINVLVVPSDRTGVGYFRSTNPHIALENQYPEEFKVEIDYEPDLNNEKWLGKFDILHFHRQIGPFDNTPIIVEKCKRLGITLIMDIDDYWAPGTHHPAHQIIKANKVDKGILANLRATEHVITTTPLFAKDISRINKNVHIIPNAIDPNEKQFKRKPTKSDRIRIGWLGGSSHLHDLKILEGVVGKIRNAGLIDKVQFVLCGFDLRGTITNINEQTGEQKTRDIESHESVWLKYEKIFTDDYKTVSPEYKKFLDEHKKGEYADVDNEPYRRVWTKPINTYATNYNLFDISIAPLEENTFNYSKSQLKVIEAAFHNKALLVQDYGPYQLDCKNVYQKGGTLDMTGNAFMIPTSKNRKIWDRHLIKLIENPEMIQTLADNLSNTICPQYSMEAVTKKRRELYLELIKK